MVLTTKLTGNLINDLGSNFFGFRNKIINGNMLISQRLAGAATTSHTFFPIDRFRYLNTAGATVSAQQSSTVPNNFSKSMSFTVTSGLTPTGGVTGFQQSIEGNNIFDFGLGTAAATTFTLSFWVRSSITGSYGLSFTNNAADRFYATSYTINSANTWEYKTITVAGDTSGTWVADNNIGIRVVWDLGSIAASRTSTTNAWQTSGSFIIGPTTGTNWSATTGATFYVTGIQIEKGSTATTFEVRPIQTELELCQRYFEKNLNQGEAIQTSGIAHYYMVPYTSIPNGSYYLNVLFRVIKRSSPTVTTWPYTTPANTSRWSDNTGVDYGATSAAPQGSDENGFKIQNASGGSLTIGGGQIMFGGWMADSEIS